MRCFSDVKHYSQYFAISLNVKLKMFKSQLVHNYNTFFKYILDFVTYAHHKYIYNNSFKQNFKKIFDLLR